MAVRTVEYTVTASGIKPAVLQCGGIQCEHNATELVFSFKDEFREQLAALREPDGFEDFYYRFEAYTGSGIKGFTEPQILYVRDKEISETNPLMVTYPLENWLTRDGGNVKVYLVISYIDTQNSETLMDIYTYPAFLKLEPIPDGEISPEEDYKSMPTLTALAKHSALRAEAAADSAEDAKDKAEAAAESTNNTYVSLTEDTFVFVGGDSQTPRFKTELIIDGEMSGESDNPVQNKAAKQYVDNHISELNTTIANLIGVGTLEEMAESDNLFFFVVD